MNAAVLTDKSTAAAPRTPKALTKPPKLSDWARTWEPDRRWLHPYAATMWVGALGWLPQVASVPEWGMALAGVASTVTGRWLARRTTSPEVYGLEHQKQAGRLATGAGVAATAWLSWVALSGETPLWGPHAGSLLLGGLVAGGLYAGWRTRAPQKRDALVQATEQARYDDHLRVWTEILKRAGFADVVATAWKPSRAGLVINLEQRSEKGGVTAAGLQTGAETIAAVASRVYAKVPSVQIGPRGIVVEPTDWAHQFVMHVTTRQVLAESIPYQPRTAPATINDPIDIGLYENGDMVQLQSTAMNLKIVGATRSGKGVLLNTMIARWLETHDTLIWVAGAAKLVPLIYPWLEPWAEGRTRRPAIDWVGGEEQSEVLKVLADALKAAQRRADLLTRESKLVASPRLPAILVLLDEASTALESTTRIEVDGVKMSASEILMKLTQIGLAVNVGVVTATQYGLMPAFGEYGSEIHRNLNARIALKTLTSSDGRDTLVGMTRTDTTMLKHQSMLVQPSTDEPRCLPAKAFHMEDVSRVSPHAERCTAHLAYLDEYTASHLTHYDNRWHPTRQTTLYRALQQEGLDIPDWIETTRACTAGDPSTIQERFDRIITNQEDTTMTSNDTTFDDGSAAARMDEAHAELDESMAELERGFAAANEAMGAVYRIAEPFRELAFQLSMDGAPKGDTFVPTSQLAIVLDRVTPDAESDELKAAAIALGKEFNKLVPALRSEQRTVNGKQVRGYTVATLWAAMHHLADPAKNPFPPA